MHMMIIFDSDFGYPLLQLFMNFNVFIIGIFFVLPCIESYQKVDLRTITLGVPPQEVCTPDPFKQKHYKKEWPQQLYSH